MIKFLSFFRITHSLKKAPKQSILKAKIDTLNKKIKDLKFNNIYTDKIKLVTDSAIKNIELWKSLELKYKRLKKTHLIILN